MSERADITKKLSLSLQKYIDPYGDTKIYWAREVTFDYRTNHAKRVDFIKNLARISLPLR